MWKYIRFKILIQQTSKKILNKDTNKKIVVVRKFSYPMKAPHKELQKVKPLKVYRQVNIFLDWNNLVEVRKTGWKVGVVVVKYHQIIRCGQSKEFTE